MRPGDNTHICPGCPTGTWRRRARSGSDVTDPSPRAPHSPGPIRTSPEIHQAQSAGRGLHSRAPNARLRTGNLEALILSWCAQQAGTAHAYHRETPRHCQIPHHPTEGTPMTVAPPSHPSHRIRPIALGVALPGVLMLAGFLRVWTWLPRIPDPAVLHWGTEGPDRTGPFTQLLLVLGVLFLVTWLPAAVFAVFSARHPVGRRLSVGVSAGMGALYAGIVVVTALPQVDVPTAEDVGAAS